MYLVFDLPRAGDSPYPSAHTVAFWLHREFEKWSERHQISYKTKYHKNKLRLILATDQEYQFFMWSWNPDLTVSGTISGRTIDPIWSRYTVVDPPKH